MTAHSIPPRPPDDPENQGVAADVQELQRQYRLLQDEYAALSAANRPDAVAIDRVHGQLDDLQSRLRAMTLRPDEAGSRERPAGI